MISMTYVRACEAFRFAWRNVPSAFAGFGFRQAHNEMAPVGLLPLPLWSEASAEKSCAKAHLSHGNHWHA
jgi:hypothetical protein